MSFNRPYTQGRAVSKAIIKCSSNLSTWWKGSKSEQPSFRDNENGVMLLSLPTPTTGGTFPANNHTARCRGCIMLEGGMSNVRGHASSDQILVWSFSLAWEQGVSHVAGAANKGEEPKVRNSSLHSFLWVASWISSEVEDLKAKVCSARMRLTG